MNQELVQAFKDNFRKMANEMHTAIPGKIISFDPASGMASVKPTVRFVKPDKSTMDFPEISGVPVCFPQGAGQNVSMAFPVVAGDSCLLVFGEQSLDYWQYGQETGTDLRFDLSNAICIPGLFNTGNAAMQRACAENAVVLAAGGCSIAVSGNGITIKGNVTVEGSVTTSGDTVSVGISVSTHTHTGDSGGQTGGPQ